MPSIGLVICEIGYRICELGKYKTSFEATGGIHHHHHLLGR